MEAESSIARVECPSCGGSGGGPFGRAGSAWDDESYVCPLCKGRGRITLEELLKRPLEPHPGIAKTVPAAPAKKKKKQA
ncbi:MAG: hypothetical protein FWD69_12100 [Polyangiaceae bacterium]|nr:hypothetical protein [Polyangiaceae bacterium]